MDCIIKLIMMPNPATLFSKRMGEKMRLKYAFMSFSSPQASLDEMLALATRYGYDGIEPRVQAGHLHGIEPSMSTPLRREAQQKALDMRVVICCIATSCHFANPQDVHEQIDKTRQCIDLAADLGAPRLRVFGGAIPPDVSREKAIDTVANALTQIAGHAQERNVMICMETHDDWCDPLHMAEVMKRATAAHPSIGVNWDIMHPVRQGGASMDAAFEILKPWVQHVHVHDGMLRLDEVVLKPIGQGEIDHRRAIQLLQEMHYSGYISGEWIDWEPPDVHLPRELATLKAYEAA
jgi:sugar phosphate isomerase/epimerase